MAAFPAPPTQGMTLLRLAAVAAIAALVLALPFVLWGFRTYQLTFAGVYAIAVLGLNLVTGQSGQISLGHGAFFALGAYTVAILMDGWAVSAYLGIIAAGMVCSAAGYLFARAVLRLPLFSLALATFALAMAVPQILKSSHFSAWTGGVQGLQLERPGAPFGLPLDLDQWWYFVTCVILLGLFRLARNLIDSRTGRAIQAIRDNPIAAQAAGIDIGLYKAGTFSVSATYTGIAGALGALLLDFVAPDGFTFWLSILLLVGSVFGGMTSVWGALAGGLFLQFWPDVAALVSKDLVRPMFGVLLIGSIWFMPHGVAGFIARRRP